jgi:hypothetical protein
MRRRDRAAQVKTSQENKFRSKEKMPMCQPDRSQVMTDAAFDAYNMGGAGIPTQQQINRSRQAPTPSPHDLPPGWDEVRRAPAQPAPVTINVQGDVNININVKPEDLTRLVQQLASGQQDGQPLVVEGWPVRVER